LAPAASDIAATRRHDHVLAHVAWGKEEERRDARRRSDGERILIRRSRSSNGPRRGRGPVATSLPTASEVEAERLRAIAAHSDSRRDSMTGPARLPGGSGPRPNPEQAVDDHACIAAQSRAPSGRLLVQALRPARDHVSASAQLPSTARTPSLRRLSLRRVLEASQAFFRSKESTCKFASPSQSSLTKPGG
jgi:hypothetical protein